jgi:tetratricopeptide (TPR) repeat protein
MRAIGVVVVMCLATALAWADDPDPLYTGRDLLRGPERARGVELLRQVIAEGEASPKDAKKQQRAGRAHMYLEENVPAVAAMERALALDPENARFAFWAGAAWLPLDVDKSLAAFDRAVALDPADADAWLGLGRARDEKGDLAGALAAFRKAVDLDPGYLDAHVRAGSMLERSERNEEAIATYRKVLELDPTLVRAGVRLGALEYRAGRFEKALAAWTAVEPHTPGDLTVRAQIVQALFALGRYADAAPWREQIRRIHASAKDEAVRKETEYRFDRFEVDQLEVVAYEQFDRSEDALYRYVFRVLQGDRMILRVNLEPSPVVPELGLHGGAFFLGANDEDGHRTFDKRWDGEPAYPELKAAVIDAIRGKIDVAVRSGRPRKAPAPK